MKKNLCGIRILTLFSDFSKSSQCVKHCSKSSFFVQIFNFDFPKKLSIFFGVKTRENAAVPVLDFLAVDNFDFTRKIV